MATDTRSLYLDLIKKSLTCTLYEGMDGTEWSPDSRMHRWLLRLVVPAEVRLSIPADERDREEGKEWPLLAQTMIGLKRLDHLQSCIEQVLADQVPGDLIETGVWRGGATIFMRAVLKAHADTLRRVWVADSFAGLPPPNKKLYPLDTGDKLYRDLRLSTPVERVRANFERYGLLDEQVCFIEGWFKESLQRAPIDRLAVIRLDGDMYESTTEALVSLYPKLQPGGFLIVDDYGALPGCRQAVLDYRSRHNITEEIQAIDWTGAFWRRHQVK